MGISTNNGIKEDSTAILSMRLRNSFATLQSGDLITVNFGFPLRQSSFVANGCLDVSDNAKGNLYYLQNAFAAVCELTGTLPYSTNPNLKLTSFHTPWFVLTGTENVVTSMVTFVDRHVNLGRQTTEITYSDVFPNLASKEFTTPFFTMTAVNGHMRAAQRDDYRFEFRLSTTDTGSDLRLMGMLTINIPTSTPDFQVAGTDCIEDSASEV